MWIIGKNISLREPEIFKKTIKIINNRSSRCILERSKPESAFWAVPKRTAKSSVVNDNSSIYYEICDLLEFFVEFMFVCYEKHAAVVVF